MNCPYCEEEMTVPGYKDDEIFCLECGVAWKDGMIVLSIDKARRPGGWRKVPEGTLLVRREVQYENPLPIL